jgi:hypothetical protein
MFGFPSAQRRGKGDVASLKALAGKSYVALLASYNGMESIGCERTLSSAF